MIRGRSPGLDAVNVAIRHHPILCRTCGAEVEFIGSSNDYASTAVRLSLRCHGAYEHVTIDDLDMADAGDVFSLLPTKAFLKSWASYSLERAPRKGVLR